MKNVGYLKNYLKGSKGLLVASFLFALLSVFCKMAVPFMTSRAIDLIVSANSAGVDIDLKKMEIYLFLIAGLLILGAGFRYLFDYAVSSLGQRIVKRMRDDLFVAINRVPLSYLDSHRHGDILLRLTADIENVQNGLILGAGAIYEGLIQILITLGFMCYLNWAMALLVVLLTPISVLVSRFISGHNARYFREQSTKYGELSAFSLESITNLECLQSYGLEDQKKGVFAEKNEEAKNAYFKAAAAASSINPSTRLVNNTIYAAVIIFGAFLLLQQPAWLDVGFTVGGLSGFLTYSYQYMTPFNEVADAMGDIMNADASLGRIKETMETPKDIDGGTSSLQGTVDSLEAKGLHFSYDGERQIINDFSLDIYKGHKIALVGTTGCGKTTIINLLMRFYDPQQGAFYMNGTSTLDIPKKELRSHMGMVLQDTWLSRASIRENIAFAKPEASFEEVVEAAKKAHADEFIRLLPNGYDTVVSSAFGLSMGQKQLLCVARIILAEPEIVLLDEATSNIDLRTELALSKAFDELMKGKTSIVVAHRLSTIKDADLILVMDQGKIMEQGNFRELMEKDGRFAVLYRSQFA